MNEKNPNIVVFTMHKSASMLIYRLCAQLSRLSGTPLHSPNDEKRPLSVVRLLADPGILLRERGCFAPLRTYVEIPDWDECSVILHLRDPRDVLVSMFYSYCFIHPGPIEPGTGHRKEVAERGIDEFVLRMARGDDSDYIGDYGSGYLLRKLCGNIVERYWDYIRNVLPREQAVFLRYEEMIRDFSGWFERFAGPFPLEDRGQVVRRFVDMQPELFPKRVEDVMDHARQVIPGDHRNKLQPSTIAELNRLFDGVLQTLGYDGADGPCGAS